MKYNRCPYITENKDKPICKISAFDIHVHKYCLMNKECLYKEHLKLHKKALILRQLYKLLLKSIWVISHHMKQMTHEICDKCVMCKQILKGIYTDEDLNRLIEEYRSLCQKDTK